MYIVTGGAGFIGSHVVRALNDRGTDDILVVDDLKQADRFRNLNDCTIADYMDRAEFRALLDADRFDAPVEAVLHQGACSHTMERDGRYMMKIPKNRLGTFGRGHQTDISGIGVQSCLQSRLDFPPPRHEATTSISASPSA